MASALKNSALTPFAVFLHCHPSTLQQTQGLKRETENKGCGSRNSLLILFGKNSCRLNIFSLILTTQILSFRERKKSDLKKRMDGSPKNSYGKALEYLILQFSKWGGTFFLEISGPI